MGITTECNSIYYLNKTESEGQRTENLQVNLEKKSKVTEYLDYIYSYPPKIKIKWNALDELKEDLFIGSNYGVLEHSLPFMDYLEAWFFNGTSEEAEIKNYTKDNYLEGFLDKTNSSNFFLKETKDIQTSLANIPVFVVLNGQGEIVLNKPSNGLSSKTPKNYIKEKLYDSCGAFDPLVEKRLELGLFFMDNLDAEKYLKEVARSDFEGTQTVGLSINCINLSTAYRITREHHPGIDFRFVPSFTEVKDLLINNIGKSDMISDDEQQQLRFRPRPNNLFPYLNRLGTYLFPSSSFLQRNEYFKGVPIYIVQLNKTPRNILFEQYFNIVGIFDTAYGRCIQTLDKAVGFGHNWIMQGSLQTAGTSDNFENFIFFDKDQALKFSKKNGRRVGRFSGGRTSNLEFLVRKPKIFVYNLEDFIEDWEDKILNISNVPDTISKADANHFVSPDKSKINFAQNKKTFLKKVQQSFEVKSRVFKRAVGVFFSVS